MPADPSAARAKGAVGRPRRVLVAHPSPDLYGSDLQMLSAVEGMLDRGWTVSIIVPSSGPLVDRIAHRSDLSIALAPFPALRKSMLKPLGLLGLFFGFPRTVARLVRAIRAARPDVLYVNTVTIPWWILAGRLARVPTVVHVREAEEGWPRLIRVLLTAPLLMATSVIANSVASRRALLQSIPRLAARSTVIYNGVLGPDAPSARARASAPGDAAPARLALVARLSPRKGIDIALEALATLRAEGRSVELDVCGSVFPGYEWFEQQLRTRAAEPDLAGAVHFLGYVNPTWPLLEASSIVLVPSLVEPFGNTAVEGLLAARPVVASATQGLVEIIVDGSNGLLVPPGDVGALAAAIRRVLDEPGLALALSEHGRQDAVDRFSVRRYRAEMAVALDHAMR